MPGHGHRPAHSSEDLDPVVGGSSGSGACGVFSRGGGGGAPFVPPPRRCQVSFADEVTLLGEEELPECSPVLTPLILPVVVEEVVDAPESVAGDGGDQQRRAGGGAGRTGALCHGFRFAAPARFLSICLAGRRWGMDVDDLCDRISGDCSLTLSPIGRVSSDGSDAAGSPEVGVLISPLADSSSEVTPVVGYKRLPLPSVDNSLVPDLVWVSVLPQSMGPYIDREFPVPRWRLAWEGPFLEERSPESIRSLGPGCAFRNTTYRTPDYAAPVGDYGLPLHHPRFVEWIGVPQSAGLIEFSGSPWVDKLSRDQAVTAAIHLQRDVGLMQTNVDVLDQYALSLQKAASRMIDNCLGPCMYSAEEVAAGALGPWIRRTAVQMEGMELWRPSLDRYGSIRMTLLAVWLYILHMCWLVLVRFSLVASMLGIYLSSS